MAFESVNFIRTLACLCVMYAHFQVCVTWFYVVPDGVVPDAHTHILYICFFAVPSFFILFAFFVVRKAEKLADSGKGSLLVALGMILSIYLRLMTFNLVDLLLGHMNPFPFQKYWEPWLERFMLAAPTIKFGGMIWSNITMFYTSIALIGLVFLVPRKHRIKGFWCLLALGTMFRCYTILEDPCSRVADVDLMSDMRFDKMPTLVYYDDEYRTLTMKQFEEDGVFNHTKFTFDNPIVKGYEGCPDLGVVDKMELWYQENYFFMPNRVMPFAFGGLMALHYEREKDLVSTPKLQSTGWALWAFAIFNLVFWWVFMLGAGDITNSLIGELNKWIIWECLNDLIPMGTWSFILYCMIVPETHPFHAKYLATFASLRPWKWIADISGWVYMWHFFIYMILNSVRYAPIFAELHWSWYHIAEALLITLVICKPIAMICDVLFAWPINKIRRLISGPTTKKKLA